MENNPMQANHQYSNPIPVNTPAINPPPVSDTNGGGSAEGNDLGELLIDEYFKKIRPGYKFAPTDYELIACYLMKKIKKEELPLNKIHVVKLYDFSPEHLTQRYKASGKNEWYFFTPRDKKYPNGRRPKRDAGNGYWKATTKDKAIKDENANAATELLVIGYKKSLVYCQGKPPSCNKTRWLMNEYRVKDPPAPLVITAENNMRLDDWVLCRIYKKRGSSSNNNNQNPETNPESDEDTDEDAEEEIPNPTVSNSIVPLEEPRPPNQAEASRRFFNPGDFNSLPVGFQGSHSIPFNQQVGTSTVSDYYFPCPINMAPPVLPEHNQQAGTSNASDYYFAAPINMAPPEPNQLAGTSNVRNYNFAAAINMTPPVLPEPQNHTSGNHITGGVFPQGPLSEFLSAYTNSLRSPDNEFDDILWLDSNEICMLDEVSELWDTTKMPQL